MSTLAGEGCWAVPGVAPGTPTKSGSAWGRMRRAWLHAVGGCMASLWSVRPSVHIFVLGFLREHAGVLGATACRDQGATAPRHPCTPGHHLRLLWAWTAPSVRLLGCFMADACGSALPVEAPKQRYNFAPAGSALEKRPPAGSWLTTNLNSRKSTLCATGCRRGGSADGPPRQSGDRAAGVVAVGAPRVAGGLG